jgi:hypothetical protein
VADIWHCQPLRVLNFVHRRLTVHPWFQASAAMLMRSTLFWDVTRRRVVILYRRFGTMYQSHLQGSGSPRRKDFLTPEDGNDTLSRKSVKDYHSTLCNIPEERRRLDFDTEIDHKLCVKYCMYVSKYKRIKCEVPMILMMMTMDSTGFWDMTPCSVIKI